MTRKTVTQLYAEFEKTIAAIDATPKGKDIPNNLTDLACELCRRIVMAPANRANPIPEMLMKIDAVDWGGDSHEGSVDAKCLASLREDLEAMQAAPSRRAERGARRPKRVAAAAH
jgi:hypothetical protein